VHLKIQSQPEALHFLLFLSGGLCILKCQSVLFHVMAMCRLARGYLCLSIFRRTYHSARCHSPEDHDLNILCPRNLKSCAKSDVKQAKYNTCCRSCLGETCITMRCVVLNLMSGHYVCRIRYIGNMWTGKKRHPAGFGKLLPHSATQR
jgi:hypothetical protein